MFTILLQVAVGIFIFMTTIFFIALIKKDNSIVDVAWGLGFVLIALGTLVKTGLFLSPQLLVTTMILAWGVRLSMHIYLRNKGKGEDPRYKKWRNEWGNSFVWRSYLQIFLLQGVMMFFISIPIVVINNSVAGHITLIHIVGLSIWLIGFYFEAAGDYQLYRFMKSRHSSHEILQSGVWRYTRHPNYFGEVTMWWGIFVMTLATHYALIGVVSPALITFLILYVSGIPMTEKMFDGNPQFEEYKKRTSAFFPWFPKKIAS